MIMTSNERYAVRRKCFLKFHLQIPCFIRMLSLCKLCDLRIASVSLNGFRFNLVRIGKNSFFEAVPTRSQVVPRLGTVPVRTSYQCTMEEVVKLLSDYCRQKIYRSFQHIRSFFVSKKVHMNFQNYFPL